jgi:DNA-binding transcriptional regulator YhcF (GntR family)
MTRESAGSSAGEARGFDLAVDRDAEIPIGVQLAWALRSRIRDGVFEPGQRLPGLREVAEATGVNVNTVRSVYQRLEHEGLIDSQQGSGTFVATTPQRPSTVASIAAGAAREAHQSGVDPREIAAALYVSPGAPPPPPADDATARRRALREQIAVLERTLAEIEAKHPGVAPASAPARRGIGPALLDAAELEHVRATLVRRLATVQGAIDGLGGEQQAGKRAGAAEKQPRQPTAKQPQATRGQAKRPPANQGSRRAPRGRPPMRPAPEGA